MTRINELFNIASDSAFNSDLKSIVLGNCHPSDGVNIFLGNHPEPEDAVVTFYHEMAHAELNDATPYGRWMKSVAESNSIQQSRGLVELLDSLVANSRVSHEIFATYSGILRSKRIDFVEKLPAGYRDFYQIADNAVRRFPESVELRNRIVFAAAQASMFTPLSATAPTDPTAVLNYLKESECPDTRAKIIYAAIGETSWDILAPILDKWASWDPSAGGISSLLEVIESPRIRVDDDAWANDIFKRAIFELLEVALPGLDELRSDFGMFNAANAAASALKSGYDYGLPLRKGVSLPTNYKTSRECCRRVFAHRITATPPNTINLSERRSYFATSESSLSVRNFGITYLSVLLKPSPRLLALDFCPGGVTFTHADDENHTMLMPDSAVNAVLEADLSSAPDEVPTSFAGSLFSDGRITIFNTGNSVDTAEACLRKGVKVEWIATPVAYSGGNLAHLSNRIFLLIMWIDSLDYPSFVIVSPYAIAEFGRHFQLLEMATGHIAQLDGETALQRFASANISFPMLLDHPAMLFYLSGETVEERLNDYLR